MSAFRNVLGALPHALTWLLIGAVSGSPQGWHGVLTGACVGVVAFLSCVGLLTVAAIRRAGPFREDQ